MTIKQPHIRRRSTGLQTWDPEVDARQSQRHPIDHHLTAQHQRLGEIGLSLSNISASGFMATGVTMLRKGDRVAMRLPVIGWIEAHVVWTSAGRAGFQFERVIRVDDFADLLAALAEA